MTIRTDVLNSLRALRALIRRVSSDLAAHKSSYNPHGNMRWKGDWIQQPYYKGDVVYLSPWTMVALRDTAEYPIPQYETDPIWLSGLDTAPAWITPFQSANTLYVGQRYTNDNSGIIRDRRIWADHSKTTNINYWYSMYVVIDPLGAREIVNVSGGWRQFSAVGWQSMPTTGLFVPEGTIVDYVLAIQDRTSVTSESGLWDYSTPLVYTGAGTGDVQEPVTGNTASFNAFDSTVTDRAALFNSLTSGDTVTAGDITRTLTSIVQNGGIFELTFLEAGNFGADGLKNFVFEINPTGNTDYSLITGHYSSEPNIQGFITTDYDGNPALDENAYGADSYFQLADLPEDWDMVAYSDFGSSGRKTIIYPEPYVKWTRTWEGGRQYEDGEQVIDQQWLMIANKETQDRAAPQAVGNPYYVYTGTSPTAPATAKQITFGNRYTLNVNGYIRGYRINVVTGNVYSVYSIDDPLGAAIVNQIITFTADVTGWAEFTINSAIVQAGAVIDLMCVVQEPDPTPTTWTGDWVYSKPNNDTIPLAGQITQSNKTLGILNINKIDDNGGDRAAELLALTQGDVIQIATGTRWSIQTFTDLGTYLAYAVAPAIQDVLTGLETFSFETVTATPITRMEDVDWWTNNPLPNGAVQGLYGQDIPYESIVPNGSAYGTDLLVQQLSLSEDWDIQAKSDFSSGG